MKGKVVVDTTFILPFFGIDVEGINSEEVVRLKNKGFKLLYPKLLLVELIAKISKEAHRKGLKELPEAAKEALESLMAETDVELVDPKPEHLIEAAKLRLLGHRDFFDNILYATAYIEKALLLTADKDLTSFIKEKGLKKDIIIIPK